MEEASSDVSGSPDSLSMPSRCSLCLKNRLPAQSGRSTSTLNQPLVILSPVLAVHSLCLHSAHGLPQRSICDYSEAGVLAEIERCQTVTCPYCQKLGGFVRCVTCTCPASFHLACFYAAWADFNHQPGSGPTRAVCPQHLHLAQTSPRRGQSGVAHHLHSPASHLRSSPSSRPSKARTLSPASPGRQAIKTMKMIFCQGVDAQLREKSIGKRSSTRSPLGPRLKDTAREGTAPGPEPDSTSEPGAHGKENRDRSPSKKYVEANWILATSPAKRTRLAEAAQSRTRAVTDQATRRGGRKRGPRGQGQTKCPVIPAPGPPCTRGTRRALPNAKSTANKNPKPDPGRKNARGSKKSAPTPKSANHKRTQKPSLTTPPPVPVIPIAPSSPAKKFVDNRCPFVRPALPTLLATKNLKKAKKSLAKELLLNGAPWAPNYRNPRGPLSNAEMQAARTQFRVKKLVKKVNAEHKPISERQLFHPSNNQPIQHGLGENEYDENFQWLADNSNRDIDDFLDLNPGEKEFMKLWNTFLHHNPCYGNNMLIINLEKFIVEMAPQILAKHLFRNFVLHLTNLHDFGSLDQALLSHMINRMRLAIFNLSQNNDPSKPARDKICESAEELAVLPSLAPSPTFSAPNASPNTAIKEDSSSYKMLRPQRKSPRKTQKKDLSSTSEENTREDDSDSADSLLTSTHKRGPRSSTLPPIGQKRINSGPMSEPSSPFPSSPSISSHSSVDGSIISSSTGDSAIESVSDLSSLDSVSPRSGKTRSSRHSEPNCGARHSFGPPDQCLGRRRGTRAEPPSPSRKRKLSHDILSDTQPRKRLKASFNKSLIA